MKSVPLPQARGGKALEVHLGPQATKPQVTPLTHKEVVQMSSKSHLTGEQQSSIVPDLTRKWGRKVVQPGLQGSMPKHNAQFSPYFTVEEKLFLDSADKVTAKHLYFCHNLVGLVAKVTELRNIKEETINLVQGDSGQGWLKICISVVVKKDLEKGPGVRIPGAGVEFQTE